MLRRQQAFGYTHEDLRVLMAPMATNGEEPLGSMGTDTSLAVLSTRPRLLYDYFKQLFAQVTNPPLDAIREELVMSMGSTIGPEGNLLDQQPESCRADRDHVSRHQQRGSREAPQPRLRRLQDDDAADALRPGGRRPGAGARDGTALPAKPAPRWPTAARSSSCRTAASTTAQAPIPSLLATAGVHHHLVREGTRTRCALVLESGDAREVHHFALLIGYGAGAVNPYLAFETLDDMIRQGSCRASTHDKAIRNYIKALNKGMLKVMSKMGISTLASYCGAQIFEAVGLSRAFVERYFTGTPSRIEGVGIEVVSEEVRRRHEKAFPERPVGAGRSRLGRRLPVAPRRRVPPVQPGDRLQAAARDAQRAVLDLQGIHDDRWTSRRASSRRCAASSA